MFIQARNLFTYYGDSISYRSGIITQVTDPIEIDGIVLGRFEIRLGLHGIATAGHNCFSAVALTPNPAKKDESVTHPNVKDEIICFGSDGGGKVGQALKEGRLLSAFMTANALLNTGEGDPHVHIEEWGGESEYDTYCEICDDRFDRENDGSHCERCDQYVCDTHSAYCEGGCEVSCCTNCITDAHYIWEHRGTTSQSTAGYCNECAATCDGCGERWSKEDIKEYPETSESLCPVCTNKRSLDDEQRQEEEAEAAEAAAQG
jgi:hypothetical protein